MSNTTTIGTGDLVPPAPQFVDAGGGGNLQNYGGGTWVLDLGAVAQGAIGQSAVLSVSDIAQSGGTFALNSSDFHITGASSVTDVGPGGHNSVVLTADTQQQGWHVAQMTFSSGANAPQTLYVVDNVVGHPGW